MDSGHPKGLVSRSRVTCDDKTHFQNVLAPLLLPLHGLWTINLPRITIRDVSVCHMTLLGPMILDSVLEHKLRI